MNFEILTFACTCFIYMMEMFSVADRSRIIGINRIYDGVEAETRKSQARFSLCSLLGGLPSMT